MALFAPACRAKPLKPNSVSGSPKAVLQALKTTKSRGLPIRPFLRIEKLSNAEQEFADKEASLNYEMDKIKSEFATKPQESDDSSVTVAEESTMTTADLQAKVAEHKAAKKKS